ncbi:HD domain-containing phosphohydrolase [Pseudomonadota bacterium]
MANKNPHKIPSNILVVDDVPANLKLLRDILIKEGYKVRPASNGTDALEAVKITKPDLILLDINMPGMDGFEVCQRLQENDQTNDIPIIFVTASTDLVGLIKGFQLGAVDFITKPFQEMEVLARVSTHLELFHMRKNLQEMVELRTKDLQQSESKYRTLFESSSDAIMLLDEKGFFDCNSATLKMFDCSSREEFLDHHPSELSPSAQPDGRSSKEAADEKIALAYKKGRNFFEWLHRRVSGEGFPAEVLLTRLTLDGRDVLQATVRDITQRKQAEESIRESLVGTISAVSKAIEARDPYTAGHQQRVASLAKSIAHEMGLDEERINGLVLGASIHDIGKIHLPAEILSKPAKLTDKEFSLIKDHPQSGYDILKDIKFPWPVSDIAYQHHERMDGSGYPQGLKGDKTCLEARIVAVADVVEAMSSHRPYRVGLGIEKALEEIEQGSGRVYDPEVVKCCLKLFREKGYELAD